MIPKRAYVVSQYNLNRAKSITISARFDLVTGVGVISGILPCYAGIFCLDNVTEVSDMLFNGWI